MENNKLIAEFMGLRYAEDSVYIDTLKEMRANGIYFEQGYMTSELKYDSDWNWLMSVVEKIESLGNDVLITSNYIQIAYNDGEDFIVIELEGNIKIFAVYNSVIKFITWYNETKQK
jgi:hypothetical protein